MASLRTIPSIDFLLQRPALRDAAHVHGRAATVAALRTAADAFRTTPTGDAGGTIEALALERLAQRSRESLRRVINATGVIVHTNLGRSPLAAASLARAAAIGGSYSNLEYDLTAGQRGHRYLHAEQHLTSLTGAPAATVVNNNAAATLLVLAALARGREVIVSRGELVEIGGGFRVPDVMAQSGAILREVGTTNRTRASDYAAAVNERTALILRVHPSNFSMTGFTERPTLAALAELSQQFHVPLFEDLGSGWLGLESTEPWPVALQKEPSVRASVAAGVDLVAFSGDKLLGGPQAGVIVGLADLIDRVRRHPLMRAVRAGKQTYAALETTLDLWSRPPAHQQIPIVRMLTMSVAEVERRSAAIASALPSTLVATVIDGVSTIGGGSAPGSEIPTKLLCLRSKALSASALEERLRLGSAAIIARIQADAVLLDLRTVDPGDDAELSERLRTV